MVRKILVVAIFCFAAVPALAGEDNPNQDNNAALDAGATLIAPGIGGGSFEERGQRNFEAHQNDELNRIQQQQGDTARLRQEQIIRRQNNSN